MSILVSRRWQRGTIAQVQRLDTGAKATGTTVIPQDNTTPQNTEGDQYMTLSITPRRASNYLWVEAQGMFSHSASANMEMTLFRDANANALMTAWQSSGVAGNFLHIKILYFVIAGSVAATTFNVRAGSGAAGTTTFNGVTGTAEYNGTFNSYIEIREYVP